MSETEQSNPGILRRNVIRYDPSGRKEFTDHVVVEEPLEIRLRYGSSATEKEMALSITMRTPGDDIALALGFLITEGVVHSVHDVVSMEQRSENVVIMRLHPDFVFLPENVQRHFYTSSSCGVCGKASIDMVRQVSSYRLIPGKPHIAANELIRAGNVLRTEQPVFAMTGGIHATALYSADMQQICTKEDIGRHNAMDKLVGWAAKEIGLPLTNHLAIVSGRGGFELIQKALAAGISIFAAVGAPSSLAIELAEESDMTLVGFLRSDRLNVYTHPERITHS